MLSLPLLSALAFAPFATHRGDPGHRKRHEPPTDKHAEPRYARGGKHIPAAVTSEGCLDEDSNLSTGACEWE